MREKVAEGRMRVEHFFHNKRTASQTHRSHPHPSLSLKGEGISGIHPDEKISYPTFPSWFLLRLAKGAGTFLSPQSPNGALGESPGRQPGVTRNKEIEPQQGGTLATSNVNQTQALGQAEPSPRKTLNTQNRPPFPSPYEGEGGRRPDEGEGLARRLVHEQDKHGVHSQTGLR